MMGTMKKICAMLMCLCMVSGLLPIAAFAAGEEHAHSWADRWTASDSHHWHACTSDGCTITSESECSGYGAHDFSQYPYRCTICEYSSGHEHYGGNATCEYNAICEGCGTVYGSTNPSNHQIPEGFGERIDDASHKIMCSCGYVFVASEPHNFTPWSKNSDGTEERWCEDCLYAQTRSAQHSHGYSKATCAAPATCSCGSTSGEKDPSNHTGGTETKNAVAASYNAEGYTGDVYCKGCGTKISTGEAIPKLEAVGIKIDEDAGVESVTFQPSEGIIIPEDASLVVKNEEAGLGPIISWLEPEKNIPEYHLGTSVLANAIYTHTDGAEYRSGEIVMIDGQKYCIGEYSGNGSVLPVISLSDGMMCEYNMTKLQFEDTASVQTQLRQAEHDMVRIDSVLYDVPLSYINPDGSQTQVLYHEGMPAGMINEGSVRLYSDQTPSSVPTTGSRYLGTVTPDNEQGDFGLSLGTKYDVYLIGANDIQLQSGSGDPLRITVDGHEKLGTLTQTFDLNSLTLSPSLFTSAETYFVAIHLTGDDFTNPNVIDLDFGETSLSPDGKRLGVTFSAYHFSPFVVYAFSKAQEPEIKAITSNTSSTSSISDVGGADDSDVEISDDKAVWFWFGITVAVPATAAAIVLVFLKKRNSKKEIQDSQN